MEEDPIADIRDGGVCVNGSPRGIAAVSRAGEELLSTNASVPDKYSPFPSSGSMSSSLSSRSSSKMFSSDNDGSGELGLTGNLDKSHELLD